MNLSDRPRSAAPAARPRAAAPAAPEPRALCPGCGRPVAMARLGRCLYCGGAIEATASPSAVPAPAPAPAPSALPPEVLMALAPRVPRSDPRRLWTIRIGALAIVVLVLVLMVAFSGGRTE